MPALGDIHIDQALTNISVMYRNSSYIADRVMPPIPVQKRSNKYWVFRKEDFMSSTPVDAQGRLKSVRAPGAEAAELDMGMSKSGYYAEEYAYRGLVTDAEVAIADNPLQPDIDQTTQLTERLLIDNEVQVAAVGMGAANYASSNKKLLVGGAGTNLGDASWARNNANTSPLTNIKNARTQVIGGILMDANSLIMGKDSALALAETSEIKELLKYTNSNMVTSSGLPNVIRGLNVIESMAQRNASSEGQPYVGQYIWDALDNGTYYGAALVAYITMMPGQKTVSFGYTFDAPDDTTGMRGITTRRWREEKRKGDMIEAAMLRDWRFIGVDGTSNGWQASGYATGGSLIYGTTL